MAIRYNINIAQIIVSNLAIVFSCFKNNSECENWARDLYSYVVKQLCLSVFLQQVVPEELNKLHDFARSIKGGLAYQYLSLSNKAPIVTAA